MLKDIHTKICGIIQKSMLKRQVLLLTNPQTHIFAITKQFYQTSDHLKQKSLISHSHISHPMILPKSQCEFLGMEFLWHWVDVFFGWVDMYNDEWNQQLIAQQ